MIINIPTKFEADLSYGYDLQTKLEGLIIHSGGGGRNTEHTTLFHNILYKLAEIKASNISIYVAAKPTTSNKYPDNEYRKIAFDGETEFDFGKIDVAEFISNANYEIREKGKRTPNTLGGSIHKRLLITSDFIFNEWSAIMEDNFHFKKVATEVDSIDLEDLEYTLQMVKKRLRQAKFRKELLAAYNNTCSVSGSKVLYLLEAAHIDPYDGKKSSFINNGILLRSDIHDLFDIIVEGKRLINITDSFEIEVHESLQDSEYWQFHGRVIHLPSNPNDYPKFKEE